MTAIEEHGVSAIDIRLGSGDVIVMPSDDGVLGEVDAEAFIENRRGLLTITTRQRGARINLAVPAGCSLNVAARTADVRVTAELSRVRVSSGTGDIAVAAAESAHLRGGSGDIEVGRVDAARIRTGSGDVRIEDAGHDCDIATGSGDIVANHLHGHLSARSGSGDTYVNELGGGRFQVRSGSGDVQVGVTEGLPVWLDLRSATGDVESGLDAGSEPEPGSPYAVIRAITGNGDIAVRRV